MDRFARTYCGVSLEDVLRGLVDSVSADPIRPHLRVLQGGGKTTRRRARLRSLSGGVEV